MAETLNVKMRDARGTRNAKRMRRKGGIPAILYGHGEANHSLTVTADEMAAVVRHGGRVVELKGAVNEKAFIRSLQWDTYGLAVVHVDFTRVSEHERVEVKVRVDLRGQAAGIKDGGIVEHFVHEVEIECEALAIPDRIEVSVTDLKIGDSIKASELKLTAGAKLVSDPDAVIVHCVEPRSEEEEAPAPVPGGVEPEVIGRKVEEEGEAEE
ncbi:MAG: 50S ribosomal protein L25 [Pirellulales bacterium]